jgi:hypothetical protein
MATIKALKTQEGDASPSGILNPFLNHTTKAMKQDITMFNSYAHMNMRDINHVVAIKIKSMKLLSMCVPKHTSKSPNTTWMIYETKWLRSFLKVKLILFSLPLNYVGALNFLLPWPNDCRVLKIVRQRGPP